MDIMARATKATIRHTRMEAVIMDIVGIMDAILTIASIGDTVDAGN